IWAGCHCDGAVRFRAFGLSLPYKDRTAQVGFLFPTFLLNDGIVRDRGPRKTVRLSSSQPGICSLAFRYYPAFHVQRKTLLARSVATWSRAFLTVCGSRPFCWFCGIDCTTGVCPAALPCMAARTVNRIASIHDRTRRRRDSLGLSGRNHRSRSRVCPASLSFA